MQEIVVPLLYDVISKYNIIPSTHMVAIKFLILHCECNLALQMASTETKGPKGPWDAHLRKRSKVTVEPFTEDH